VIAGNHELSFDEEKVKRQKYLSDFMPVVEVKNLLTNCIYLQDSETDVFGVRIYGSPVQPEFCDWAFNVENGDAIKKYWDLIPVGVDILITHGPPLGHCGATNTGFDAGCEELIEAVKRVRPVVHLFGHIHEAYGVNKDEHTYYINACTVNYNYIPTNSPIVFDVIME